ncbi:MAG: hypothetical protein NZ923_10720, partial [Candidatus Kryptonium sp.]|nr:hypothetical protein [Candidatus Kryptonium sp.]
DEKIDLVKNELKSEINGLKVELKRLDEKVDLVKNELRSEIDGIKGELSGFKNEFRVEIKRLDEKIDIAIQIRERLAALESKVASLIK